jgi:hypothetical protein
MIREIGSKNSARASTCGGLSRASPRRFADLNLEDLRMLKAKPGEKHIQFDRTFRTGKHVQIKQGTKEKVELG